MKFFIYSHKICGQDCGLKNDLSVVSAVGWRGNITVVLDLLNVFIVWDMKGLTCFHTEIWRVLLVYVKVEGAGGLHDLRNSGEWMFLFKYALMNHFLEVVWKEGMIFL